MAKKKSTAPSGLSIARDGLKFTISWKIPSGGYGAGQWLYYRLRTRKTGNTKWAWSGWKEINVGKKATSKTLSLNANSYYPVSSTLLNAVEFKVKGKREKDKKHTYTAAATTKQFDIATPNTPSLSYSLDDTDANKGSFTWETSYSASDGRHFLKTQVQTALMKNFRSNVSAGAFSTSSYTSASGTWSITEDGSPTQTTTYCRIVRVRARGCAGDSAWGYSWHYYSIPSKPTINSASSKAVGTSSRYVLANWTQSAPQDRPVDAMELQYAIDTPSTGEQYSGGSWTTGVTVAYHDSSVSADFNTDDAIAEDQIMWLRVQSTHDKKYAYSESYVAARGALKVPSFDSVAATGTTLTINELARNTEVDYAKTAIWIKIDDEEKGIIAVTDKEGTITVDCPDVSGATEYQVAVKNFTGTATATTGTSGTVYNLTPLMQSGWVYSATRKIAVAPSNVQCSAVSADTASLSWDWSWKNANAATIAWADHADAWNSTDEPSTYDISDKATAWNVGGLEEGNTYYFRVRLRDVSGEDEILSPWSDIVSISLSETPTTPTIAVTDNYYTMSDTIVCSVGYTGNTLANIKIAESIEGEIVKNGDSVVVLMATTGSGSLSETVDNINKIYTANDLPEKVWKTGETHYLKAMVTANGGGTGAWSDAVPVEIVAEPEIKSVTTSLVSEEISYNSDDVVTDGEASTEQATATTVNYLEQLPLTIAPAFGDSAGDVVIKIVRNEDYYISRPDELKEQHFTGEIVASFTGNEADSCTFDLDDLTGQLDDGGKYSIKIIFTDIYSHMVTAEIPFTVRWKHQPEIPEATAEIDTDNRIAIITVTQPTTYVEGDTFNLYRLSIDRPELILENGIYGQKYVDPYPALNEHGGIMVVNKTANGDYITSDNSFAWSEYEFDFSEKKTLIEFDEETIEVQYDMSLDNSWAKDFERTTYLGGSVQGDWNPAVTHDLKISGKCITTSEPTLIEKMRRLSDYPGICHMRTPEGSSFTCDIQVAEKIDGASPQIVEFDLTVSKVDSEELDGMTYTQWRAENGLE